MATRWVMRLQTQGRRIHTMTFDRYIHTLIRYNTSYCAYSTQDSTQQYFCSSSHVSAVAGFWPGQLVLLRTKTPHKSTCSRSDKETVTAVQRSHCTAVSTLVCSEQQVDTVFLSQGGTLGMYTKTNIPANVLRQSAKRSLNRQQSEHSL